MPGPRFVVDYQPPECTRSRSHLESISVYMKPESVENPTAASFVNRIGWKSLKGFSGIFPAGRILSPTVQETSSSSGR